MHELFGMSWETQIIVFGLIALVFFAVSQYFIWAEKPGVGLFYAVLELIAAGIATWPWMWALRVSGKLDWFLLGILGYPPIGLIFWSMFVVGIRCVVLNIRGLRERHIGEEMCN